MLQVHVECDTKWHKVQSMITKMVLWYFLNYWFIFSLASPLASKKIQDWEIQYTEMQSYIWLVLSAAHHAMQGDALQVMRTLFLGPRPLILLLFVICPLLTKKNP